ncbi:MAG: nucleotidyltransferase family protein [Planctomycetes bacterium]|nr:nucleotidyltransferase family protein [Planctomycetota bacterium]MBI3848443.1 nucleotidyltransferase family protein [Planctomycetota bacterium]
MIHAIVLAAGKSERLGRPKALLDFDGETTLSLVCRAALDGGAGEIVLVTGAEAERVEAAAPKEHVKIVRNPNFEKGQTTSLKAGIAALPDDAKGFLLFPVDYPMVKADDVKRLLDAFTQSWTLDPGKLKWAKKIFVPVYIGKRGHPALFDISAKKSFLALGDDEPAHTIVRAGTALTENVPSKNPFILVDVDTEEDYQKCLAEHRKRRGSA